MDRIYWHMNATQVGTNCAHEHGFRVASCTEARFDLTCVQEISLLDIEKNNNKKHKNK